MIRLEVHRVAGGVSYALYLTREDQHVLVKACASRRNVDARQDMLNLANEMADLLGCPIVERDADEREKYQ